MKNMMMDKEESIRLHMGWWGMCRTCRHWTGTDKEDHHRWNPGKCTNPKSPLFEEKTWISGNCPKWDSFDIDTSLEIMETYDVKKYELQTIQTIIERNDKIDWNHLDLDVIGYESARKDEYGERISAISAKITGYKLVVYQDGLIRIKSDQQIKTIQLPPHLMEDPRFDIYRAVKNRQKILEEEYRKASRFYVCFQNALKDEIEKNEERREIDNGSNQLP